MNVLLNNNAAAFDNVTYLLNHRIEGSTWYREGQAGSCTETPYAGAWAMIDWMVQSWNTTMAAAGPGNGGREDTKRTVIDFFPGIDDVIRLDKTDYEAAPARVATAQFYRMGSRGGAIVSGKRELVSHNATHFVTRTGWVGVEAPATARTARSSFIVRTTLERPLAMRSEAASSGSFVEIGDGGLVEISGLSPGETVALYSQSRPPEKFSIAPLKGCPSDFNHWGLLAEKKKGKGATAAWPCL